ALHARERPHAGVAALELLHDEPVLHVVEPSAAVLLRQVRAEHPHLTHLRNELLGKTPLHVGVADHGEDALVDESADAVADGSLLLADRTVEVEEVERSAWDEVIARRKLTAGDSPAPSRRPIAETS